MIILHGSMPMFGVPEFSPFVTKTEVQLQMMGLPYQKVMAMPEDAPKGQIPFLDDDGTRIADSHFIREHLEKKYGKDLDAGLDPRQRAEAWAIERMLENHFCGAVAYARWLIPENFRKGPAHLLDGVPEEARENALQGLENEVRQSLRAVGIARHSDPQIVALAARSLDAFTVFLGDKPCLYGDRPVGVDAIAFALLAGILTPFFDSPLRRCTEGYPTLVAYTARMMRQFYPEFPWETPR